jgi:allantoinase
MMGPLRSNLRTSRQAGRLVIRGNRVVTPDSVRAAAVLIQDGVIAGVVGLNEVPKSWRQTSAVYDAGDSVVMPGLVDTHVHINEPGRTEWEGFDTATRAAAAGGTTVLVDMPLNSIPATTTLSALREKRAAARGKCWVDVGFWGGVVPGNSRELKKLHEAGALGFKCFLVPSGVAEFQNVSEPDLHEAMPILAKLGSVLLVHAELPGPIERATAKLTDADPALYRTWLRSRPPAAEAEAIELMLRLCQKYRVRTHIVHLSFSGAIRQLRRAKKLGLPVTVETCPHYLAFSSASARGPLFKCAPPIRDLKNNQALWAALRQGIIDFVVTDHSPCPPEMKLRADQNFFRAWGGISSLELRLPVMWTAARLRGFGFLHLARWLAGEPAHFAGLSRRKGSLMKGCDADVVIWNPEARFEVRGESLQQRHKQTPYAGRTLMGVVETTFLRGRKVFDRGNIVNAPAGVLIERGKRGANGR